MKQAKIQRIIVSCCLSCLMLTIPPCLVFSGCKSGGSARSGSGPFTLRAAAQTIDDEAFKTMLDREDFFDKRNNRSGDFPNRFVEKTIRGQKIVEDSASRLMWSQSGSERALRRSGSQTWLEQLNKSAYAGFSDWRIPTLEEAMSLLEPQKTDGYYINPLFDRNQHSTWTCDLNSPTRGWSISFNYGCALKAYPDEFIYLRPVRSARSQ